jgi:hypothetical protein
MSEPAVFLRLPLVESPRESERTGDIDRIVRENMENFVVRSALECGQAEKVRRAWREAASEGR